jgi:hypothetical protein
MATASSPTVQYGFAFGDDTGNQWLFGGAGQGVQVLQVDGLEGLPNLRTQDTGRGYADGGFSGRDFLDSRSITFTLQIMTDANASMQTYLAELQRYLMPQRSGLNVLQVFLPGGRGVRRIYGRVRRRQITVDPQYAYGRAVAMLEFFCPDPRFYSDLASVYTINSLSYTTRSYPRTYNLTYPTAATGASGNATANNLGNYETWPSFSVTSTGSASNITLYNYTTNQFLNFPTLTLGTNDTLVIDTDLRTILLNSNPSRNLLSIDSRWFSLPPGVPTTIGLQTASGTANCTITYRDAYI